MTHFIDIFILSNSKLSSHMTKISRHIIPIITKFILMINNKKVIVSSGSNKGDNNDDPSPKFTHIQNSLLMRIFNIPEKDFCRGEVKLVTRKVRISLVKS